MPSLAAFIRSNTEIILGEWVAFARSCAPAGTQMDLVALRDHGHEILNAICEDIESPQNQPERTAKARGLGPPGGGLDQAAGDHGAGRAERGFTLVQMITEYRALRACVMELWQKELTSISTPNVDEINRFHEAIDQALAASVLQFDEHLSRSKQMFLAVLGHDLRAPLNAVMMAASHLIRKAESYPAEVGEASSGILSSGHRMTELIRNLIDLTRVRLGHGIPLSPASADLGEIGKRIMGEVTATSPEANIHLTSRGNLRGQWDSSRLEQVLSNLTTNAIHHGSTDDPITVRLEDHADGVEISVHNMGNPIPDEDLSTIFAPFKRISGDGGHRGNLGLGLYIAKEIVHSHHGTIEVSSSKDGGTRFTVRLPRVARPQAVE